MPKVKATFKSLTGGPHINNFNNTKGQSHLKKLNGSAPKLKANKVTAPFKRFTGVITPVSRNPGWRLLTILFKKKKKKRMTHRSAGSQLLSSTVMTLLRYLSLSAYLASSPSKWDKRSGSTLLDEQAGMALIRSAVARRSSIVSLASFPFTLEWLSSYFKSTSLLLRWSVQRRL